MSKQLPPGTCHGENVGVLRLTEAAAQAAFAAAASLVHRGQERDWLGAAVNAIAHRHPIACVDVAGVPWVEIDFPHDLAAARTQIWPRIESLELLRRRSRPAGQRWSPTLAAAAPEAAAG
jgi:choline kinase